MHRGLELKPRVPANLLPRSGKRLVRVRPRKHNGSIYDMSKYDRMVFLDPFYIRFGIMPPGIHWYMKRLNCVCKGAKLRLLEPGKPLHTTTRASMESELYHYILLVLIPARNTRALIPARNTRALPEERTMALGKKKIVLHINYEKCRNVKMKSWGGQARLQ